MTFLVGEKKKKKKKVSQWSPGESPVVLGLSRAVNRFLAVPAAESTAGAQVGGLGGGAAGVGEGPAGGGGA